VVRREIEMRVKSSERGWGWGRGVLGTQSFMFRPAEKNREEEG